MKCTLVFEICRGAFITENLAIASVDRVFRGHYSVEIDIFVWLAVGIVTSQFAVEVIKGAALLGVIRLGEIDVAREVVSNLRIVSVLSTVFDRDGVDRVGERLHHGHGRIRNRPFGAASHGMAFHLARAAFQQGHDRALMTAPMSDDAVRLTSDGQATLRSRSLEYRSVSARRR